MVNRLIMGIGGLVGSVIAAIAPGNIGTKLDISDYLVLDIACAQPASPRTNTIDIKVEQVPYTEYRKVIEKSESVVVMYYSSSKDTKDEFRQRYTQNEHGLLFINWMKDRYADNVQRYVVVDLPLEIAGNILIKEAGMNRYPSIVYYRNGKAIARIRGPPTDNDIDQKYARFEKFLKEDGLLPKS